MLWEITPILYLAGPHSQGDLRDVPADSELTKNDRHKRWAAKDMKPQSPKNKCIYLETEEDHRSQNFVHRFF